MAFFRERMPEESETGTARDHPAGARTRKKAATGRRLASSSLTPAATAPRDSAGDGFFLNTSSRRG
jgi:hypothetical protein